MSGDDRGEDVFLLLGESGHVAVGDDVGAVPLITAVGDREPDLVKPRCPRQHPSRLVLVERPRFVARLEEIERGALDARGLFVVDAVLLRIGADGAIADVLVVDAAEQVVEHAFAQCAGRRLHALDRERAEDGAQDRDAAGDHRLTFLPESGDVDLLRASRFDQSFAEPLQTVPGDDAAAGFTLAQRGGDRADRARRAKHLFPTEREESALGGTHLDLRLDLGALEGFLGDLAVLEEPPRPRHTAHVEAREFAHVESLADDHFRAPTTDVDHQPATAHE